MSYIPLVMVLSQNGDSLYLKVNGENLRDVKETDSIHPKLKEISEKKDDRAVLLFLQQLAADKDFEKTQSLKTYHMDAYSMTHSMGNFATDEGPAHECSLNQMISFIFKKILDSNPSKL